MFTRRVTCQRFDLIHTFKQVVFDKQELTMAKVISCHGCLSGQAYATDHDTCLAHGHVFKYNHPKFTYIKSLGLY